MENSTENRLKELESGHEQHRLALENIVETGMFLAEAIRILDQKIISLKQDIYHE